MDKNAFVNFLKVMPPFYGCVTDKFLDEIKLHKDVRTRLLREFDTYVAEKDDKSSWFKYLASMPANSKNSKGQYRILKYYQTFPHCKIERKTLEDVVKIKDDNFITHFLLLVPYHMDSRVQYCLGECIEKNKGVKEALFKEISADKQKYFLTCLEAYSKYRRDKPVPKESLLENKNLKLLAAPKKSKKEASSKLHMKKAYINNELTKKRISSSRVPFAKDTDDLWDYLCKQSCSHEFTVCRDVYTRIDDKLAYTHKQNLITVQDGEQRVPIHANSIFLKSDRFILAQYPSNQSIGQFLRVALQNDVSLIFDLTQDKDIDGINKYYETGEYDDVRVKCLSAPHEDSCGFVTTEIECCDSKDPNSKGATFYHIRYSDWKNFHKLPIYTMKAILEFAEKCIKEKGERSQPLVHCGAGLGRSAIFICALHILREIKAKKMISARAALKCVADTIWSVRVQRGPDCIQNYIQLNSLVQLALNALIKPS